MSVRRSCRLATRFDTAGIILAVVLRLGKSTDHCPRMGAFFFRFVALNRTTFALPYTISVGLFSQSPKIRLHKGEIDLKYTKIIS